MPQTHTDRGFPVYAELTDSYGADVRVVESSRAMIEGEDDGPWVWIFVSGGAIDVNRGSAHLELKEAIAVRDALTEFIDSCEEEQ